MTNKTRKYAWLASAVTAFALVAALAAFIVLAGSPGSVAAHEPDTNVANHHPSCAGNGIAHDLPAEIRGDKNADGTDHNCDNPGMEPTANTAPARGAPIAPLSAIMAGGMATFDSTITDADGDTLTWTVSSSDPAVATAVVDNMGGVTITGVGAGTATITVTATDPSGESASQNAGITVTLPASRHATMPTPFQAQALDNGARLSWDPPETVADGSEVVGYRIHRDAWHSNTTHPINMSGDTVFNEITTSTDYFDLGLAYETVYTYQVQAIVEYDVIHWWNNLNCAQMNALAGSSSAMGSGFCQPYAALTDAQKVTVGQAYDRFDEMYPPMASYYRYALGALSKPRTVETADSGGRLQPLLDPPTVIKDLNLDPSCADTIMVTWSQPDDFGTVPDTSKDGVYVGPDYIGGKRAGKEEVGVAATSVRYEVQRRVNKGPWMRVSHTDLMYTDTDVEYGHTYEYRVRAINPVNLKSGWVSDSEELIQPPIPNDPRNLRATVNDEGSVVLQWTAPEGGTPGWRADDIADGVENGEPSENLSYRIERVDLNNNDTVNSGDGMLFGIKPEPHRYGPRSFDGIPHEQTHIDADPHSGRVIYVVTAFQDNCLASEGNSVSLNTTITGPGAPENFTATAESSSSITLEWDPPANAGSRGDRLATITGYVVTRTGGSVDKEPQSVTGTSYSDSGLAAGTTYTYNVRTVNSFAQTSVTAATASETTKVDAPPEPPILGSASGLNASMGSVPGTVQLNWMAGANSTRHWLAGVKVSDWRAGDFSNVIFRATSGQSSDLVTGLDSGEQYAFTVLSGNADSWDNTWAPIRYATPN